MPAFTIQQRLSPSGDWATVPVAYNPTTPSYGARGGRTSSAGATSRTPALPTGRTAASWLWAMVGSKNNANHSSATAGWTKFGQVNSGASWTVSLWYYDPYASGNNPTGSVTITVTWTGSAACFGSCWRVQNVFGLGASSSNTGTTNPHSTTGITTTGVNSRVMYADGAAANTAMATPAGWTENSDRGSNTGATREVFGGRNLTSSGSSSGNISVNGANAAWVQWQIELLAEPPAPFLLSPSSNITASGENTTAQLTQPGTKTFVAGRIQDDENPADNVDVDVDEYTEMEWSLVATASAEETETYQFRILNMDTYDVHPEVTIGGGGGGPTFIPRRTLLGVGL